MEILVIDLADTHTNYPGSESYRLKENTGGWWTGVRPPQAALIQRDGQSREQQPPWRLSFFLAVEELLGCSGAFRRTLFSTASDWAPILQSDVLSPPSPSLSVFFQICFRHAVHPSLWHSTWASCVAWPTAEAHCWHSFNPAALKHLWYHRRKAAVCRNKPRWVKLQMAFCVFFRGFITDDDSCQNQLKQKLTS